MKTNKLLFLSVLLLFCSNAYSQQRRLNLTDFKTWSIQANGAMNWAHTDVVENSPFYSKVNYGLGYGLRLNKFLTHNFGVSLDGYRTSFEGVDGIWSYKTKINYQVSVLAMIQTGNINYLPEFEKFQLYGYLGYGSINYESSLVNSNNSLRNNEVKENEQVIPVGVGVKYHLKENVTLNLEYSINNLNGDNLDAFNDRFTEHDSYSKLQFGISYTFGKYYNKELEWHDPRPRPVLVSNKKDTVVIIQKVIVPDSSSISTKYDNSIVDSIKKDSADFVNSNLIVFYEFNEYKLSPNDYFKLQEIAYQCSVRTGCKVVVESFTDTIGSHKNNIIIVKRRAGEIIDFLKKEGLNGDSIVVNYHDENDALMPTDAENRRSIVYLIK